MLFLGRQPFVSPWLQHTAGDTRSIFPTPQISLAGSLGSLGSQLLHSKARPNFLQYKACDLPLVSSAHIPTYQSQVDKEVQRILQRPCERQRCDQAGPKVQVLLQQAEVSQAVPSPTVTLVSYFLISSGPSTSLPQHKAKLQLRMEGMRCRVLELDFNLKISCKILEQTHSSLHKPVDRAKIQVNVAGINSKTAHCHKALQEHLLFARRRKSG